MSSLAGACSVGGWVSEGDGEKMRKEIVEKEAVAVIRERRKRERGEEEEGLKIVEKMKENQQKMTEEKKTKKKKQNGQCQQSFKHTILLSHTFKSHLYIPVRHLRTIQSTCKSHVYI